MDQLRKIPFKRMSRTDMESGIKTCTARARPMAAPGDRFYAFGGMYAITAVTQMPLAKVQSQRWQAEGCDSPQDFEIEWEEIHPRRGFDPAQQVYVHDFRRAD
jgi:hypothetical protein